MTKYATGRSDVLTVDANIKKEFCLTELLNSHAGSHLPLEAFNNHSQSPPIKVPLTTNGRFLTFVSLVS